MSQFISESLLPAMYEDGFESSHPILGFSPSTVEAISIFDRVTYDKGAALLFMLESIVGEENLRNGLKVSLIY
jgi:aminopeptidase N